MDQSTFVQTSQIVTLILFLGALGAVWLFVQRNRDGLARKVQQGRRITVAEVTAFSPTDRAMILAVDNEEFLILRTRGCPPIITKLAKVETPKC